MLVIIIICVLLLVAYYVLVLKKPKSKPILIYGYADDKVTLSINDQYTGLSAKWPTPFRYQGEAKSGDVISFIVENTDGPGGFICNIEWNGIIMKSNPTMFKTTNPVNICNAADSSKWWGNADLTNLKESNWLWSGNCNDTGASSTKTFTVILP
jgi:hypothetical protein